MFLFVAYTKAQIDKMVNEVIYSGDYALKCQGINLGSDLVQLTAFYMTC